ncbi:MAG: DUF616 domain-containing protein [Oribacterium sp.]|nr:DUF616 domain-containing protein [Oribacterium sp.]
MEKQVISLFCENMPVKVVLFGTGKIGTGIGYEHIKAMGLTVAFFCDNDKSKWGKIIKDDIYCISPKELLEYDDCVVFILTNQVDSAMIREQLLSMGKQKVIEFKEIAYCDEYVDNVLNLKDSSHIACIEETKAPKYSKDLVHNEKNKKIALYTCITGNYEPLIEPAVIERDYIDYYYISEKAPIHKTIYNFIDIKDILPKEVRDYIRQNRFCKILGCDIFKNYPYSIYIDGKVLVNGKLSKHLSNINDTGITLRKEEPPFDCIYKEAAWSMTEFAHKELIRQQMQKYYNEGMPRHYGAFDCTCLIRDNQNEALKKVMLDWWNEVFNYSFRDQNSFTYALWKNGYRFDDIKAMPGTLNNDDDLLLIRGHR